MQTKIHYLRVIENLHSKISFTPNAHKSMAVTNKCLNILIIVIKCLHLEINYFRITNLSVMSMYEVSINISYPHLEFSPIIMKHSGKQE